MYQQSNYHQPQTMSQPQPFSNQQIMEKRQADYNKQ